MAELNQFEAVIPGQSLSGPELGAYPWENPPAFASPDEAFDFIFGKIAEDDVIVLGIVKLLQSGVAPDTITDGILLNAFMSGQITPDVSIILREPMNDLIRVVGQQADVKITELDTDIQALNQNLATEVMEELIEGVEDEEEDDEEPVEDAPRGMMAHPAEGAEAEE